MSQSPSNDQQPDDSRGRAHDQEWMEQYGYFLTEEFEEKALERLIRVREIVIESVDAEVVDDSVVP